MEFHLFSALSFFSCSFFLLHLGASVEDPNQSQDYWHFSKESLGFFASEQKDSQLIELWLNLQIQKGLALGFEQWYSFHKVGEGML